MTKRFSKYVPDSYNYTSIITIVDHETNKRSGSIDDFVDMMNALHEENEQLKKQLDETIEGLHKEITTSENVFEGLMNENKELRDACKNYDWYKLYNQLLNENEQLESELQDKRLGINLFNAENTSLMEENEQLKIALKDKENLISICEKKFKELGYLITCDDDGYTVEKI